MSRRVTKSKKNREGDIIGLCGIGWSCTKAQAITDIKNDSKAYYVSASNRDVYVRVASRNGAPYLTTKPDGYRPNNLDDLPDC